jgi:hypothetical protein
MATSLQGFTGSFLLIPKLLKPMILLRILTDVLLVEMETTTSTSHSWCDTPLFRDRFSYIRINIFFKENALDLIIGDMTQPLLIGLGYSI